MRQTDMSTDPSSTIISTLQQGEIDIQGEFLWGSNYTFSVQVCLSEETLPGVYKPNRGERPLWDFPSASLSRREVAAYLVSEALGWQFVPPTVYRGDGPLGPGSLQLFVEHDPEYHYFNLSKADLERLRPVALFDVIVNNADRKGSHVLFDEQHKLWLIDHGICFHRLHKLRTVIWDFAGEKIPAALLDDLRTFRSKLDNGCELAEQLRGHLTREEITALIGRTERLLRDPRFPDPHPNRRQYPWPPV